MEIDRTPNDDRSDALNPESPGYNPGGDDGDDEDE